MKLWGRGGIAYAFLQPLQTCCFVKGCFSNINPFTFSMDASIFSSQFLAFLFGFLLLLLLLFLLYTWFASGLDGFGTSRFGSVVVISPINYSNSAPYFLLVVVNLPQLIEFKPSSFRNFARVCPEEGGASATTIHFSNNNFLSSQQKFCISIVL